MNEFLKSLKEDIQKIYEDAILYSEPHSKQSLFQLLLKIELEAVKSKEEAVIKPAKQNVKRSYNQYPDEIQEKMYLIAYCFSYFGHTSLYPYLNQKAAFETAARAINVKMSSLKNTRDMYDGQNSSPRKGWKRKSLPPKVQHAKDILEKLDRETIIKKALKVLKMSNK